MPGMGRSNFANAVFGQTGGLEAGALFDAALTRLAASIGGISASGAVTWSSGTVLPTETFTSGGTLSLAGMSAITCSTSPTALAYTMPLPGAAGVTKTIANIASLTTGSATLTMATGGKFTGAGIGTVITFTSAAGVTLVSTTSSQWAVTAISTNATVA